MPGPAEVRNASAQATESVPAAFTTTHWSVVVAAGNASSPAAAEALARLCRDYWRPLYSYVRRRGYDVHDAEDLVQAFFERAIEKNYVGAADRHRGRFRTFLLAALEHFLAKEWQKSQRLKRGGGRMLISIDETAEDGYRAEPADPVTAERIYDRRWALTLLEQALNGLRREYSDSGRIEVFESLAGILSGDKAEVSYGELAGRLGMSEGSVKVAAHRLRQRYGEMVRAEIANTVSRPEQVDQELRELMAVLRD